MAEILKQALEALDGARMQISRMQQRQPMVQYSNDALYGKINAAAAALRQAISSAKAPAAYVVTDEGGFSEMDGIQCRYAIERQNGDVVAWVHGEKAVADELIDALTTAHAPVYTYGKQPDNVVAWRFGEACANAKPGGDPIDRGLSLLQQLQEKGYGIVAIAAQEGRTAL